AALYMDSFGNDVRRNHTARRDGWPFAALDTTADDSISVLVHARPGVPRRRLVLGPVAQLPHHQAHLDQLNGAVGRRVELFAARGVLPPDRHHWLAPLGLSVHRH